MTIKASGRSVLILATGLFVCFAGPSQAAAGAEDAAASTKSKTAVAIHKHARHGAHHLKKYAHRRSGKVALKSAAGRRTDAADDGDSSSAIPPSVANANAQLTSADTPTGTAAMTMSARASDILQAAPDQPSAPLPAADAQPTDAQVVSADQLNDVDRALRESTPPAAPLVMASAEAPAAAAAPVAASSNESSALDQTSLIGKILIGLGALLTMTSAARMFMA